MATISQCSPMQDLDPILVLIPGLVGSLDPDQNLVRTQKVPKPRSPSAWSSFSMSGILSLPGPDQK